MEVNDTRDKQLEIYEAIDKYIKEKGYSPSVRELCEITNKGSPATVHFHLKKLKEFGFIDYVEGKNRTIRIVKTKGRVRR